MEKGKCITILDTHGYMYNKNTVEQYLVDLLSFNLFSNFSNIYYFTVKHKTLTNQIFKMLVVLLEFNKSTKHCTLTVI